MPTPVIAIFDIGKTNKKLFLFNERYEIIWEKAEQFAEIPDEDGDPCEDLKRLTHWVESSMSEVLDLPDFTVRAVNFSTYGASLVYLDAECHPIGCLYNYLKPYPDAVRRQFYQTYGDEATMALQTASPNLDSLNSGLMLYRIKYDKPRLYWRIWYALHLPQYLSFLFTRQVLSDVTSIGCHTMLWDFEKNQYHDWVRAEKLDNLFAPVLPSDSFLKAIIMDRPLYVGVGLHDSSAALIPYLASFQEPFVLISTGTWCVSMNPFNSQPLTPEELQYDCLNYMHYKGQPVKASRLFAGYEHEQQTRRLAEHFHVAIDHYVGIDYNPVLIEQLREHSMPVNGHGEPTGSQMLSMRGSLFAERNLSAFATYEEAYHQLMLDIIAQQLISTNLVLADSSDGRTSVKRIFVDGGFGKNPIYMNLLATAFPDIEVFAASVAQASALGAALAIHHHWNPLPLPGNSIELKKYTAFQPQRRTTSLGSF
ncbi:carbohydrate kinase [Spirosoma taeanense]|uniref:Carbohydrate kinase n=1 Tax=Spirosoma taeanense TaxID=2735870 RepID=A0A6M5YAX5_9BACT|nr:FGGY family carbohydrate kinase [Spirosoma taeanense]QJW90373.1 carbohydrate kinase [Spirosoma taeanense]